MSLSYYFYTEVCTIVRTERIAEHLVERTWECNYHNTTTPYQSWKNIKKKHSSETTPQISQDCAFQEWTASGVK